MTAKYDVKRELKTCYSPKNTDWEVVDVPELRYLAIDGHGDPNTSAAYRHAVEALYATAYTLKFASKRDLGKDYVVGPLEGLWWADDMGDFLARRKDNWQWKLLIHVPDWITADMIDSAEQAALTKKELPAIADIRTETLHEGTSAQVLHIGSYDDETPILARLHDDYLPASNLRETGPHHEIYLSDPRRTAPAKLKTILRQPVEAKPVE
ncbi:MAG TPA: GyrI-like domain-containing protein [Yinghuangia sp.]|uniref:GyrI-like domain-containing protein n=1 Tax=Yinghuangia sp. YIM S10712 TaxID=3436930 RepID=UPI002CBF6083|nr:GyrI-like domain-containing protein [Yinghuangia sp.]